MRRLSGFLAIFIVFSVFFNINALAYEPDVEIKAKGGYMVNLDSGEVAWERAANERMVPASLTKIVTAIVALENTRDLKEEATAPAYIYDEFQGINISHAGIQAGETLTMEDLLYAMLMQSANEAAKIVADHVGGGSVDKFVEMMNQKVQEIGAKNTHFANPHGLYADDQYTTPYDMALITQYAMKLDGFMDMVTTVSKEIGPTNIHEKITLSNRNKLMIPGGTQYYAPAQGVKTGTLEEAGACLISTAEKDGFRYLLVLMNAPLADEEGNALADQVYIDSRNLYEWAFNFFQIRNIVQVGERKATIKVNLVKDKDTTNLAAGKSFSKLLPKDIEPESIITKADVPESIDAPIEKGKEIGKLLILYAGEQIGEVPLVAMESLEQSKMLYAMSKVKEVFSSFAFKFIFLSVLIFLILYITVMVIRNYNKKRYSAARRNRKK